MSPLVEALDRLNRKERFCLLSDAVERVPDITRHRLSPKFIAKLEKELRNLHPDLAIPNDAWWALDYHFDWLFAVLAFAPKYDLDEVPRRNSAHGIESTDTSHDITGTPEDCDLIVAFDANIILIEAKVGAWQNPQIRSKMKRLKWLPLTHVKPYFVLASPKQPDKMDYGEWPDWAEENWRGKESAIPYRTGATLRRIRMAEGYALR